MLRKFAQGEIKKQILPGSNTKSIIEKPELNSYLPQTEPDYFDDDGRNYVNINLDGYDEKNEEFNEVIYLLISQKKNNIYILPFFLKISVYLYCLMIE